jgi:hypothetical protein
MNYYKIKPIADRILELLTPVCEPGRVHIAGSIRREKADVKDIEIVCQPKKHFVQKDLFGNGEWYIIPEFKEVIETISKKIEKGTIEGKMMQIHLKGPTPIMLDLFLPEPNDYFRQYAIRTGSADYAAKKIAWGWRNIGWCGTDNAGLRMQRHCIQTKSGWHCIQLDSPKPPAWQSEEEFFQWIGEPFVNPRERNL